MATRLLAACLLSSLLAVPTLTQAIPTTWDYFGVCTAGDCSVVGSLTGTLTGDPATYSAGNEINEFFDLDEFALVGDLTNWTFTLGGYTLSGDHALGTYNLDSAGNIVSGTMLFGDLFALEFLDVGSGRWTFSGTDADS